MNFALTAKEKETLVGLNLYKPNYLQDKFEDNLCKKILELKGDELDLNVIRANIRTLSQFGFNSYENINQKNKFKRRKSLQKQLKKLQYSNSYLFQISNLMFQSKNVNNYYNERRNLSNHNQELKIISSPMMSFSHFFSPRNDFNKTRNNCLSPTKSSKGTLTKKFEPKYNRKKLNELHEELKLIQPENEEFFRFDDRLSNIPDRIIDRLKLENNYFKTKEIVFNDSFTRKKEAIFRIKDPLDKSKYLRKEYFDKRSPYTRTSHLIEIRHSKRNDGFNQISTCKYYTKPLIKCKNQLEFSIND